MIEGPCFHCGLPVPKGLELSVSFGGDLKPMCCIGCQAVASAIINGGLEQFYKYRSDAGINGPANGIYKSPDYGYDNDKDLSIYDLPEVQNDLLRIDDQGLATIELTISGITCGACAWLIEHHLNRQAGVDTVRVNVSRQRCRVQWRLAELPLSLLLQAFSDIGFRAYPANEAGVLDKARQEQRRYLLRMGLAGIGMMQAGMLAIALYSGAFQGMEARWENLFRWVSLGVATPVVLYSAQPFFSGAWRSLRALYLTMDVPIAAAIGLAYLASGWATVTATGEVYFDAVAMLTFFLLVGRFLEMRVRYRNDLVAGQAAALIPITALKFRGDGYQRVPVKSLIPGDVIELGEGECLAADGTVLEGQSRVVEAVLTGEQSPVEKKPGDTVSAGTINSANRLKIEVSAIGSGTRLASILDMVDAAVAEKPRQVEIADRLAGWFVALLLVLASVVFGTWWWHDQSRALWVTLSVLVVTCPCALSLATPVALAAATGRLQRQGFLIRRAHVLQTLARISRVVLDKTGTLTSGQLEIQAVEGIGDGDNRDHSKAEGFSLSKGDSHSEAVLLDIAAALELGCKHPIARAFCQKESSQQESQLHAEQVNYQVGGGVSGIVNGQCYALGKADFVAQQLGLSLTGLESPSTLLNATKTPGTDPSKLSVVVMLASEQGPLAWFVLRDALRPGARVVLGALSERALPMELLSGDQTSSVSGLAADLGIEKWRANSTPEDKLDYVRNLQRQGEVVLMLGDGINDVPVLSGADISVAMGEVTDFTHLAADAVLLSGHLDTLTDAIDVARKTEGIIRQNIIWALVYNGSALPLAAMGWVPPWAAAIGMSISSLVVVLNAMRLQGEDTRHKGFSAADQSQVAMAV
ncbi:MAG: heavy metal translocating P-type ATPase [Porticoccaceae bacterium]|nr:heavy metal translocating P-type ATPase [Porticoccaceae bacterium]